jgi:hypothetical protein
MQRFPTMRYFVRVLVALFLVAQFAGVVSSPLARAHAAPSALGAPAGHQHAHGQGHGGCAHQDSRRDEDRADYCCALHAFLPAFFHERLPS